jgi:hypothetical protein
METQEERGWRRDHSGGLTSGGGAARQASSDGERNSMVALGVRGARGEEVKRGGEDEHGGVGRGRGRIL